MAGTLPDRSEGMTLIRRMAEGDGEAFSTFYTRYAALAFGLIRRILPQAPEAEDVLQEVFWQVWQEARRYDERRGSPEAWLLTRARSRAIDRLRSIRRRDETVVPLPTGRMQTEAGGGGPGDLLEDQRRIQSALALLPEPQRQVIELAFWGGLTQSEIARRLDQPLGTVKTRMRAGLDRLRSHFHPGKGRIA
jgi:RNA polymerase sigma-70 factor (ECF subfamily)